MINVNAYIFYLSSNISEFLDHFSKITLES